MSEAGKITKQYWIECATCGDVVRLPADTKADATYAAKQEGWKNARGIGWVCSECAKDATKCRCGKPGSPLHTCPFASDVENDNKSLCNCCDDCTSECAMDI